jgi:transposase
MNTNSNSKLPPRVIGFDSHPDSFTAAILRGNTPASAVVEKVSPKIAIDQLQSWARRHCQAEDLVVLEASGNSFQVVRSLQQIGVKALVLESGHLGKLKEAHANNDRLSAVRIGKAYLAGTAKEVWLPDQLTQERRDWFLAHQKAVKRTTQLINRLRSYLSDQGIRLPVRQSFATKKAEQTIQALKPWSPRQWQVLAGMLMELRHAHQQRKHWESLMSQEVIHDPKLLSLVRLCGIRDLTSFACGAVIGDINRFADPKKLVNYIGLSPSFDDSGNEQWRGGVRGHGRRDLRSCLIQGAHAVLRTKNPLSKWAHRLLRRKGDINLVVVAVARKMAVAIWYLLKGQWTSIDDIEKSLEIKVGKIVSHVGNAGFKALKKTRKQLRKEIFERLKTGRVYYLDPNRKMVLPT